MRPFPATAILFLPAALTLSVAAQAPPQVITDRLEAAFRALDGERFAGSFTITARSEVSKVDGKNREEGLEVRRVTMRPGEEPLHELLRAEENGEDVTAENREREAERQRHNEERRGDNVDKGEDEGGGTFSAFLKLPMGDDLVLYCFDEAVTEGGAVFASFSPLPQHRKQEGIATGRLAWDQDSLDPVWIEAQPADLPRGAKELSLRFELARVGDLLYIGRTVTDGVGGFLWIKRRFHIDVEITDVLPAE